MSNSAPDKTPQALGTLWEIPAKSEAKITRPDGKTTTVMSGGKVAIYVLDQEGDFLAEADGNKTHTVKAG